MRGVDITEFRVYGQMELQLHSTKKILCRRTWDSGINRVYTQYVRAGRPEWRPAQAQRCKLNAGSWQLRSSGQMLQQDDVNYCLSTRRDSGLPEFFLMATGNQHVAENSMIVISHTMFGSGVWQTSSKSFLNLRVKRKETWKFYMGLLSMLATTVWKCICLWNAPCSFSKLTEHNTLTIVSLVQKNGFLRSWFIFNSVHEP